MFQVYDKVTPFNKFITALKGIKTAAKNISPGNW
jgi:hypothetical protein